MKHILPKIGDRIVVHGMSHIKCFVKEISWIANESRWKLMLDWGEFGTSHVYDSDENHVWYKYISAN